MSNNRVLSNKRVLRYTLSERVIHWIVGLTFVYLLLTGLAFYSPNLYWIAVVMGGGPTTRFWHPVIGIVYTVFLLWMYVIWRRDMRMNESDRAWSKSIRYYIRNEDEKMPPSGRFNAGQKQFFWVMLLAGILLLLSGLVLWLVDAVPWNLQILRHAAVLIHVIAALLSIGGFIIHIYMGLVFVPGSLTAITRGEVSKPWARTHHALWLNDITGETSSKK